MWIDHVEKTLSTQRLKIREMLFFRETFNFYMIYALLLNTTEIYMELNYLC